MRIVAILAVYNEQRFIAGAIEHLRDQGVEVYVIDNESTDRTREIADGYIGRGVIEVESFPRPGHYSWRPLLARKEHIASTLDADWFMHVDADEIHLPPRGRATLAAAIEEADAAGSNAIDFSELTFIPTIETPDHDHPAFRRTMLWYYPFLPFSPHLLRAWKRSQHHLGLSDSGGHHVLQEGARIHPERFPMKHYLFLSVEHAVEKYVRRKYDPAEVEHGWHRWRAKIRESAIRLPPASELRTFAGDEHLDFSSPWTRHYLQALWEREE